MLKTEGYENSQLFMALTPKNGVKASKLYSYKPIDGTGDFHWSRNHTAYRLNQSGVLELMGNNVPRVDYTNTCPELLIEKESENLLLRSQEFDNAAWSKDVGTTITSNFEIAPNGTTTANRLQKNSSVGFEGITQNQFGLSAGVYTYSIYVKSNTNINQNAIILYGNFLTQNIVITNQWQRFDITFNAVTTVDYIGFGSANNALDVLIWGAQLEESDYATSYIPTTNTTQTRPKDVCYNTANGYNDADWSVVMRVRLNNIGSSADEPLLALSDGTTDYYFAIYTDSNPKLHFTWYNNPDQDTYSTSDLSNGIVNVGVSFDSVTAEYIIVIDGTMEFAGTLVNNAPGLFGNFNRLDLGSIVGTGSPDKDAIIGVQYFNSALIQSDLENLTS